MNLDYVIVSTDNNPFYDGYWEIVRDAWINVVGVKPILVVIGDYTFFDDYGDYIKLGYKKVDGIPTSFQSQISRLYATSTFIDKTFLISDLDMLPMSKSYFIDNSKNVDENNLIIYTSEVYGWVNQQRYAMCYNLGKGGTYNEILDLECSFEEFVHRLFSCNFSPLWDTDELYLGKCVYEFENKENNKNRITKLERGGWGEGYAAGRIDREYWGKYDFGKILEGFYIDSHLLRPYNENKEEIDKILNLLYKRNENN